MASEAEEVPGRASQDQGASSAPELDVSTSYLPGGEVEHHRGTPEPEAYLGEHGRDEVLAEAGDSHLSAPSPRPAADQPSPASDQPEEEVFAQAGPASGSGSPSGLEASTSQLPEPEYSSEEAELDLPGSAQPAPGSALVPPLRLEGTALRRTSDAACEVQVRPGSSQPGLPAETKPEEDDEADSVGSDRCAHAWCQPRHASQERCAPARLSPGRPVLVSTLGHSARLRGWSGASLCADGRDSRRVRVGRKPLCLAQTPLLGTPAGLLRRSDLAVVGQSVQLASPRIGVDPEPTVEVRLCPTGPSLAVVQVLS